MVDYHGSQCGFCTPGFIMSLFALYKNNAKPGRREIDDALAGNLCRCTGYRPIIEAGYQAVKDSWLEEPFAAKGNCGADEKKKIEVLKSATRPAMLSVDDGKRRFFSPRNVDELAGLVETCPDAVILAGGTDVGLWVTKQHRELGTVIYTGNVDQLREHRVTKTHIDIGAAVTLSDAMLPIIEHYPELEELFLRFASPPIRNAGTLGGNIANGSPIGDSMPALMVVDIRRERCRSAIFISTIKRRRSSAENSSSAFLCHCAQAICRCRATRCRSDSTRTYLQSAALTH
jgi:xanthine dehydrogenase small subunit